MTNHDLLPTVTAETISPAWLNARMNISSIQSIKVERIGADIGLTDLVYRIHLTHSPSSSSSSTKASSNAPSSVVIKILDSSLPYRHPFSLLSTREILFYTSIAPRLDLPSVSKCYYTFFDPETRKGCILLEDGGKSVHKGHLPVATVAQSIKAMSELGKFHGKSLKIMAGKDDQEQENGSIPKELPRPLEATIEEMRTALPAFRETWLPYLGEEGVARFEKAVNAYEYKWLPQKDSFLQGLVHGDYRIGNVVFGHTCEAIGEEDKPLEYVNDVRRSIAQRHGASADEDMRREAQTTTATTHTDTGAAVESPVNGDDAPMDLTFKIVDWATLSRGPILADVAYFLALSLDRSVRRGCEFDLIYAWYTSFCEAAGPSFPSAYPDFIMSRCVHELSIACIKAVVIAVTTMNHVKAPEAAMRMFGSKLKEVSMILEDWKSIE